MRPNGSLLTFLRHLERSLAKHDRVEVPCNGCTACCRDPNMLITVNDDEAKRYRTHINDNGIRELDRQPDGACTYLVDGKCTTYADRPRACRVYDCRFHMLGAPLGNAEIVRRDGVIQWRPFSLPTTEDKIAFIAITMLVKTQCKRDPDMKGLAYTLLQWQQMRSQAREIYDEVRPA